MVSQATFIITLTCLFTLCFLVMQFSLSLFLFLSDLSEPETVEKKDLSPGGHTRNEKAMDKVQRHKNKQDKCMNTHLHILKILTVLSELGTALIML